MRKQEKWRLSSKIGALERTVPPVVERHPGGSQASDQFLSADETMSYVEERIRAIFYRAFVKRRDQRLSKMMTKGKSG